MSDPSTTEKPFPFLSLPTEIQCEIIRCLLPAMILPVSQTPRWKTDSFGWGGTVEPLEYKHCAYLRHSCKQIKSIVDAIRPIATTRGFNFDPKRDTLKVWEMKLPSTYPWDEDLFSSDLPIHKLLTVFPSALNPNGRVSRGVSDAAWDEVPLHSNIDFTWLVPSCRTPMLEEITLLIEHAGWEWHIDGFQMFGPDVADYRRCRNGWGLARVGRQGPGAASEEYFKARGIQASTPYRWQVCCVHVYDLVDIRGLTAAWVLPSSRAPYIGFYGYSRGDFSHGGNWAGFHYYVDTGEVEFSPLAFSEISYATDKQDTPEREPENGLDTHFVSRLWIIRPGKPAPPVEPHHCWVKVKAWEEGDPEWVRHVENTWKMVRHTLEQDYNYDEDASGWAMNVGPQRTHS